MPQIATLEGLLDADESDCGCSLTPGRERPRKATEMKLAGLLGSVKNIVDISHLKEDSTVMAGGAVAGLGYNFVVGRVGWFDSPAKRIALAFVGGVVGPKLARKASSAMVSRAATGIQGAMGAIIGMELYRAFGLSTGNNTAGAYADAEVQVQGQIAGGTSEAEVDTQDASQRAMAEIGY